MKTANFNYKCKSHGSINGKVTLKDDGKVSVSLNDAKYHSAYERNSAKNLAAAIVKADFNHEAAFDVKEIKTGGGSLVAALTEKTQDLHDKFIEMTKTAAKRMFDSYVAASKRTQEEWCDKYGVKYEYKHNYMTKDLGGKGQFQLVSGEYNRKEVYTMRAAQDKTNTIVNGGYDKYEAGEVKYAEQHYKDSTIKLAQRLNDKGITDGSQFEITTGWVGVNLEITIKHGNEITKAWTIVAEGQIQRAHYRYLVK